MVDPDTYKKALRAARNVARSSARAAVGLGLLTGASACGDSGSSTTSSLDVLAEGLQGDGGGIIEVDVLPGTLSDALLSDVSGDGSSAGEVVTTDTAPIPDEGFDGFVPMDDVALLDSASDAVVIVDSAVLDGLSDVAVQLDAAQGDVLSEVMSQDTKSTDVASTCLCLTPTLHACTGTMDLGLQCESDMDCDGAAWDGSDTLCGDGGVCLQAVCNLEAEGIFGLVCYEGVCQQGEGWGECCEAAYADAACLTGSIPGCTPWGPPGAHSL